VNELPVTIYWAVCAGGTVVAVFPLALKQEAKDYAVQINGAGRNGKFDAKVSPAAIQGWIVAPEAMP
jgi:hypothetical protein